MAGVQSVWGSQAYRSLLCGQTGEEKGHRREEVWRELDERFKTATIFS
jgi:hypothetical protein